jgi:hypothetical protein
LIPNRVDIDQRLPLSQQKAVAATLGAGLRQILGQRSGEMLKLAGSTIRNVSRGVVGIALVQSFLAGVGFLAAGIPAAGFFSFSRARRRRRQDPARSRARAA